MVVENVGSIELRKETVDRLVRGFALRAYKIKQLCSVVKSSSWKESYYQEGATDLAEAGAVSSHGVPRGSDFPFVKVDWTKVSALQNKAAFTGRIFYEDAISDEIDVISRTLLRISRAVVKKVDTAIYDAITDDANIQTFAITAGHEWDSLTTQNQDPLYDIARASALIEDQDYDAVNLVVVMNPTDYRNFSSNQKVRSSNFKPSTLKINGALGAIDGGATIMKSNSVTADEALVMGFKDAVTYKELDSLKTDVTYKPFKYWDIDAIEIGLTQVIEPKKVVKMTNTRK